MNEGDYYFFTSQAYRDCDVYNSLPRGMNPSRYPYRSKVCISREAYILESQSDPLVMVQNAVHMLNKYGDPDGLYDALDYGWTTPRSMASFIEDNWWNGYGVSVPFEEEEYASCVRSAGFLVLEIMLGCGYGDEESKGYADQTAQVFIKEK